MFKFVKLNVGTTFKAGVLNKSKIFSSVVIGKFLNFVESWYSTADGLASAKASVYLILLMVLRFCYNNRITTV